MIRDDQRKESMEDVFDNVIGEKKETVKKILSNLKF